MNQVPTRGNHWQHITLAADTGPTLGTRIFLGGMFLSALAGFVDVVLIDALAVPVSHMTGSMAKMSISLTESRLGDFRQIFLIVASFLAGTILSTSILGKKTAKSTSRFGLMLCAQGIVLALAAADITNDGDWGLLLAALACGMQNAMSNAYCGLSIKTTHVTGMITDIGILLGCLIRDRRSDLRRLSLLTSLLLGFVGGGIAADSIFMQYGLDALWLVSFASGAAGLSYWIYRCAESSHVRPFVCVENPQCPYPPRQLEPRTPLLKLVPCNMAA